MTEKKAGETGLHSANRGDRTDVAEGLQTSRAVRQQIVDAKTRSLDWNEKAVLALRCGQMELAILALEGRRKEESRRRRLQQGLSASRTVCARRKKKAGVSGMPGEAGPLQSGKG